MGAALAAFILAAAAAPASSERLAVVGGTLIDGTGRKPVPNSIILIEAGRIVAAGPRAGIRIPEGTRRLDARGKFVIPGLMDANVHLLLDIEPEYLIKADGNYEPLIEEAAQVALKNGVTTVFDTWGPRQALVSVRDAIESGRVIGSRIFLAGNIIGFGGPMSPDFIPAARAVISKKLADEIDAAWEQGVGPDLLSLPAEEVRTRVRAYAATGSLNFLKYGSSGHVQEQLIAFSPEAQRSVVEEAHAAGLTAQAHTSSVESLRMALDAGVDLVQHCDVTGKVPIPPTTVARLVKEQVPCAALIRTNRHMEWVSSQAPSPQRERAQIKDINDRNLIRGGALILLSTDAGVYGPNIQSSPFSSIVAGPDVLTRLGEGHFLWLEAAAERGMATMEILMAATSRIALAYNVSGDLGTVQAGKRADLIILDDDPLRSAKNYRKIRVVLKDGAVIDRAALPLKPLLTGDDLD